MAHLLLEKLDLLLPAHDHLRQHRLLLPQLGDLLLEAYVFFPLVHHAELQGPVQALHQGSRRVQYFIVYVLDFGAHALELLPVQLDQGRVILHVLVSIPHHVLALSPQVRSRS